MKALVLHESNPLLPMYWLGLSGLLLVGDYIAGPFIQFPVTYLIPVAMASWFNGRGWGIMYSFALPIVRLFFNVFLWTVPWTMVEASVNCVIRILVFSIFAILIDRTAKQNRELSREVDMLSGLLPICSFCKKIRDDEQQWQPIESYISTRTEASFSHGVCPDCADKHYGHILNKTKRLQT